MTSEIVKGKEVSLQDAVNIATLLGEDVFRLLTELKGCELEEWAYAWNERIKAEFRRRIETGYAVPLSELKWHDYVDERFIGEDYLPFPDTIKGE